MERAFREQFEYRLDRDRVDAFLASLRALPPEAGAERMRAEDELREHWADFCDCDPVPEGFPDRMEKAGLVTFRKVTKADLEQPFAEERGIERGSYVWDLTEAGRQAFAARQSQDTAP